LDREPYNALDDLPVQTLGFRAPEILFGDWDFGPAIDVFTLGLVLIDVSGSSCFRNDMSSWSVVTWRTLLFRQLGTPVTPELLNLPNYPVDPPKMAKKPWDAAVVAGFGPSGEALLEACLAWGPLARPTCKDVLAHEFLAVPSGRLVLGGFPEVCCGETAFRWTSLLSLMCGR
jgi:serine/threonine protein kinase